MTKQPAPTKKIPLIALSDIIDAIDGMDLDDLVAVKEAAAEKIEGMKYLVVDQLKAELQKKMETFGITAEQLGLFATLPASDRRKRKQDSGPPKYLNPETNETWSGRGRPAAWMQHQIAAGKKMEDFINPEWQK